MGQRNSYQPDRLGHLQQPQELPINCEETMRAEMNLNSESRELYRGTKIVSARYLKMCLVAKIEGNRGTGQTRRHARRSAYPRPALVSARGARKDPGVHQVQTGSSHPGQTSDVAGPERAAPRVAAVPWGSEEAA